MKRERRRERETAQRSRPSCPSRSSTTIKQHISTPIVNLFVAMRSKHVLMPHHPHSFIVNVQPTVPTTAVFIRVEHIDRIVPAARRLAVVVEHPIKLVASRLRRFPGNGCHGFCTEPRGIVNRVSREKQRRKSYQVEFRVPVRIEQAC